MRLGTRRSALALAQAELIAQLLGERSDPGALGREVAARMRSAGAGELLREAEALAAASGA